MPSAQGRMAELATTLAIHTQRIDSYLTEKGLPQPSFKAGGPVDLELPAELEGSRLICLEASQELNDLLQGPRNLLFNHQHNQLIYLKLISDLKLADAVPLDGEISYGDLSAAVGVDRAALTRILRLGIAHRVFSEPHPGMIAHSAASRLIADDSRVSDWVGANVHDMWPSAPKAVDALIKWPLASEPNQTGFSLANDTPASFYQALERDPERARRFGGAMSCFTTGEGFALHHLTNGFAWSSLGSDAVVVDVGGSHGDAAFALASKFSNLRVIVQELPGVVASSSERAGVNVRFMEHDFFKEQPINADVYVLRWILHNWPDAYCIKILRALIPALKIGAKMLVMELVMPPLGLLPNTIDRKLRAMDVTMLEIGNAKERDLEEWKELFLLADERFVFQEVRQPPGSNLSIIEVTWES